MIANQSTPIYVPAKDLVDIYIAGTNAKEVQIDISGSNVITAELVDGGVTEAKLSSDVKTKLNKTWEEVGVAKGLVDALANGQVKTNTEAIDALETRIDEVEEDYKAADATLKEEIDGKADKGNAIIDNTTALVRSNPENVLPYASINEVGGMTRKCTNLFDLSKFITSGVVHGTVSVSGNSMQISTPNFSNNVQSVETLRILAPELVTGETYILTFNTTSKTVIYSYGTGEYWYSGDSKVVTDALLDSVISFYADGVSSTATISNIMLNEGTEALPYEPYFEGLRSAKVTEFKSIGTNLFGGEALADTIVEKFKGTKNEDGKTVSFYSANATKVLFDDFKPDTQYSFILYGWNNDIARSNLIITYTDGTTRGTNFSAVGTKECILIHTDPNKSVKSFSGIYSSGTTHLEYDKCGVFEGAITIEDFKPYVKHTLPIPEAIQAIDGYGWGVSDTVYNYIDFEKKQFVKNVEKIVFDGSEKWNRSSATSIMQISTSISHNAGNVELGAIASNGYVFFNEYVSDSNVKPYFRMYENRNQFYIEATLEQFASVEAWKTYLSEKPVEIFYPLAEPVITDISDILSTDNFIAVEDGGTIEVVTTDEYTESIPTNITYYTNNNEIIGADTLVGNLIGTASRAISDDKGNEISSTYATKEDLGNKSDTGHKHTADDITSGTLSSDRLSVIPASKGGTGKTSLVDSANALINALGSGDSVPTDTTCIITQGSAAGYTDYFYRRPASLIWDYIKSKADSVYESNDLEIGGRNILQNSNVEKTQVYNIPTVIKYEYYEQPISNEQYTLSFDAKTSNGTDVMYVSIGNDQSTVKKVLTFASGDIPSDYKRFSVVIDEWPTNTNNGIIFIHYTEHGKPSNENNTGTLYIKNIKLEKGGKATDWTPAPEDVDSKIDSKVDKVSGKGLSTNDYTTDEKNKLAGIAAGANVNQNAFSNVKVGSTTIVADTTTDTLTLTAGSNITLTPSATNDEVTITANIPTSLKNPNALTFGSKTYDGSSAITLSASDLGLEQAMKFIGSTTTAISDGSTTSTITVNSKSVTATAGNVVLYNGYEYVWTGSIWEQLGQEGSFSLKTHKHTVTHTPAGTVSTPTITVTPNTTTVNSITAVGSLPSLTYTEGKASKITAWSAGTAPSLTASVSSGPNRTVTLSFGAGTVPSLTYSEVNADDITAWSAGSLPTKGSNTTVVTSIKSATSTQPTFTGTSATLTTTAADA